MKTIQTAVADLLEQETGIHTHCGPCPAAGEYPLLTVEVEQKGSLLLAGGTQVEQTFQVTVTAAADRERLENTALLSGLVPILLRGVPLQETDGTRMLRPLDVRTRGEELLFSLEVCTALPWLSGGEDAAAEHMETLHLSV